MHQNSKTPRVSVIIPCYNHGKYIVDAIRSVEKFPDKDLYEIIIVNDGSTDEFTNKLLKDLAAQKYNVIFQKNEGLATARNNGIAIAKGEYILPLDSDNMIRPDYIYKGIKILDENRDISVVYGNAEQFGEKTGPLNPGTYNLQKLMLCNYIDACAFYRKQVWEDVGGYDKNMPATGFEDWEMWLHASFIGFKFRYVEEVLFDYRVLGTSMLRKLNANKIKGDANIDYLIEKHKDYFGAQYIDVDIIQKLDQSPLGFIGKLLLKKYFPLKFNKLVQKGKLRKYI